MQLVNGVYPTLKKQLRDKSKREFDAYYMGSQIAELVQMAAALEVPSNETSGERRDIIKRFPTRC
jgi:hypothetical protein